MTADFYLTLPSNALCRDSWFFFAESNSSGAHSVGDIEVGYYVGLDKPIRTINNSLACMTVDQKVKLSYSDISQKVIAHMTPNTVFTTQCTGSTKAILGLQNSSIRSPKRMLVVIFEKCLSSFTKRTPRWI